MGLNRMFANQQLVFLIKQKVVDGQYDLFNCFDCVLESLPQVCKLIPYNENSNTNWESLIVIMLVYGISEETLN